MLSYLRRVTPSPVLASMRGSNRVPVVACLRDDRSTLGAGASLPCRPCMVIHWCPAFSIVPRQCLEPSAVEGFGVLQCRGVLCCVCAASLTFGDVARFSYGYQIAASGLFDVRRVGVDYFGVCSRSVNVRLLRGGVCESCLILIPGANRFDGLPLRR